MPIPKWQLTALRVRCPEGHELDLGAALGDAFAEACNLGVPSNVEPPAYAPGRTHMTMCALRLPAHCPACERNKLKDAPIVERKLRLIRGGRDDE